MTIRISHDHIGLSVTPEDLDATLEWYSSRLGFTVDDQFESHGTTFTFIVSGDVKIEVMTGASRRRPAPRDVFSSMDPARLHHVCLAVEDLDAAVSELGDLGEKLIGGPMQVEAIGQRIAFLTDNLGNIIELTEPGTRATVRRTDASTTDPTR